MTLRISIAHTEPQSSFVLEVEQREGDRASVDVVRPGQTYEAWIHSGKELRINERAALEGELTAAVVEPAEFLEQFFAYAHLPAPLQDVSRPFWQLAKLLVSTLPKNPERTVALRKLLEAKDCAVRAKLAK